MPSSYTPSLRLEEQGIGENGNTWGNKLNVVLDLIDKSIAGHVSVAVSSGDVVLTSVNSAEDQARYRIIELTGTLTADVNVQVPEVSKDYVIWDSTTRGGFAINLRLGAAGATTTVPATTARGFAVATDGTSWRPSSPSEATQTLAGIVRYATTAEAQAGTSTTLALSPSTLQDVTATETRAGVVELATDTEAQTGTDTARAITPANLQAVTATETRKGVVELATDAEAQAGTDTERALTPASLQSVTATEARKGVIEIATQTEVDNGTDTSRAVTPATLDSRLTDYQLKATLASSISDGSFDPGSATLVWSGSATSVNFSALSEGGAGFYWVRASAHRYLVYADPGKAARQQGSAYAQVGPSDYITVYGAQFGGSATPVFEAFAWKLDHTNSTTSETALTLEEIYKV